MKRTSLSLLFATLGCACLYSQIIPLLFTLPNDNDTPVNKGQHKSPPRNEMPVASYDSESGKIVFEFSGQIDGATYYIKDINGNISMCGLLEFTDGMSLLLDVNTLSAGEYSVEIINENYVVTAEFLLN